jgi:cell division protease FtsH
MPSGWVWLLLLAMLLVFLLYNFFEVGVAIDSSDFDALVAQDLELAKQVEKNPSERDAILKDKVLLKRVVAVGTDQLKGEIESPERIHDKKLREKFGRNTKFSTRTFGGEKNFETLKERLETLKTYTGLTYDRQDEVFAWAGTLLAFLLPTLLFIAFFVFFILPRFRDPLGGGFINNYIKSPARRYDKTKQRVTFDDVADMENAKSELQEIVEFLRTPDKFQRLGAQVP